MKTTTKTKALAWLLCLMMAVALMPGLSFAEEDGGEASVPFTASAGGSELTRITPNEGGYTPYAFDAATYEMKPADPVMLYKVTVPEDADTVDLVFPEDVLAYNYTADGATYLAGEYENDGKTGVKEVSVKIDYDNNGEMDCIQVQTPYDDNWVSTTLYAITFDKAEPSETYKVDIDLDGDGGIKASKGEAAPGETITVTVEPDPGYKLDNLEVTAGEGDSVAFTDNGDGTFSFEMPAADVKVMAHIVADEGQHDAVCPSKAFEDLDTSLWYHEGIDFVISEGIMNGVSKKKFGPNTTTTRAMIVTMLWRMSLSETGDYSVSFEDVEEGSWYADAVKWAAEYEIVKGYNDKTFGPDDPITREQLAAILFRYAEYKETAGGSFAVDLSKYEDQASISDWAMDAMTWCVASGIIGGVTDTTLQPGGKATRAQVATILMRYSEKHAQ